MAPDKLKYWVELPKIPIEDTLKIDSPENRGKVILDGLLDERGRQRQKLLDFIIGLTKVSFGLLALVVVTQIIVRILLQESFSVFDGHELKFLISGVFGQIIGLIAIIVNSLWNDKNYLDILKK